MKGTKKAARRQWASGHWNATCSRLLASGYLDGLEQADAEEEALRSAERLVYGWPSRNDEPTGVRSAGRFVKAFPLDFPRDTQVKSLNNILVRPLPIQKDKSLNMILT